MSERERSLSMYSQEEAQYEELPSPWPFEIRSVDEKRAARWMEEGFAGKELAILGPPQASVPGIRLLGPIVEMAQTLEVMGKHGMGMPEPTILCPININAWANGVSGKANQIMANFYGDLAAKYLKTFHPDLPHPTIVEDDPSLVSEIARHATKFASELSLDVLEKLMLMANNHSSKSRMVPEVAAAGYLLAHYFVYGWVPSQFDQKSALLLVPHSETRFEDLMYHGAEAARIVGLDVVEPDESQEGPLIVGYLENERSAHYYLHNNEPPLARYMYSWLSPAAIRGGIKGFNGRAQQETAEIVELIERDITIVWEKENGAEHNLIARRRLQQEVLQPLAEPIYYLTNDL